MHLEFSDEQLELRDSARAILARECPPRLVREVAVSGAEAGGFRSQLSWLGWPALTVDVDFGGLGRGFVELAVVLEELGRAAAPGPFLATMTQFVPAVREAGSSAQVSRFLSAVAAGQLNGTLALYEGGRWDPFSI
ncbi:MAG: acyl-CoA dehydrogenase family protein, partial [Candidatus Limnocylindrales bacterium]